MKIGLLDDNPSVLEYMTVALELAGHRVVPFGSSVSLLNVVATSITQGESLPYDLLIVDLVLSGGESGVQVLTTVRDTLSFALLPVMIVSAAALEELEQLKARFPEVSVLRKPFSLHLLLQAVELISTLSVQP